MAERSNASSRSGTPSLWGSAAVPSGLTFNAADVPNLLMPFAAAVQQPAAPDEVDHFMGQEPPPATSFTASGGGTGARDSPLLQPAQFPKVKSTPAPPTSASSSFFDQSHFGDFVVGFGSAPPAAGAVSQPPPQPFAQSQTAASGAAANFAPVEPARRSEQSQHYHGTPQASFAAPMHHIPPGAAAASAAAGNRSSSGTAAAAADYSVGSSPGLFPGLSSLYRSPAPVAAPSTSVTTAFDHGQAAQPTATPPTSYQTQLAPPPAALRSSSLLVVSPNIAAAVSPNIAAALAPLSHQYRPVQHHWFYRKMVEGKVVWVPFSRIDSANLEKGFLHCQVTAADVTVPTDGGRYDVDVIARTRCAAYWLDEEPTTVRRCSWFYKDELDHRFVPYEEDFAAKLEDEYRNAIYHNVWHKRLEFPGEETIVMHNPNVIVHFRPSSQPDEWGTSQQGDQARPLVVKRGAEEVDTILQGEPPGVDHLVFVVQGIGPVCDLRFRTLAECVDDIRATAQKMVETHYRSQVERGRVLGRIEFLPVRWHEALRSCSSGSGGPAAAIDAGVNSRLQAITPEGVRKLRQFSNETLLDILFYTSPFYSQKIVDQVSGEMNRMYEIFQKRHPNFRGPVSVTGHSLGALILFDVLSNQGAAAAHGANASELPLPQPSAAASGSADVTSGTVNPRLDACEPVKLGQKSCDVAAMPFKAVAASGAESETLPSAETIESVLKKLGLSEFTLKFHQEQIDIDSLVLFEDDDWKELGLPLGPRKKLKAFLQEEKKHGAGASKLWKAASVPSVTAPASGHAATAAGGLAHAASGGGSSRHMSVSYEPGSAGGVGRPACSFPQLSFSPACFFALGSPIAMFLTIRGIGGLSSSYHLPTCPRFFNIFHPYDPVAYRMEPLVIHPDVPIAKPLLVPHHKGRKRMHLELKESLSRVGSDLKQKFLQSLRSTWNTIHDFALAHRTGMPPPSSQTATTPISDQQSGHDDLDSELVEAMANLNKDVEDSGAAPGMPEGRVSQRLLDRSPCQDLERILPHLHADTNSDDGPPVGLLNSGRRLDYVLQEGPLESFNEYLFSLASHVCYWESEDTALMIVREVYSTMSVQPDERAPSGAPLPGEPFRSDSLHSAALPSVAAPPPLAAGSLPPFSASGGSARHGMLARMPGSGAATAGLPNAVGLSAASSTQPFSWEHAAPPPMSGFVARH